MNGYKLPITMNIGGIEFAIRSDFRTVLNVLCGLSDPELDNEGKTMLLLKVMYPSWEKIPPNQIGEAVKLASDFIDCGQKDDGRPKSRTIDWEQDSAFIIPAVNSVAHTEVRSLPYLHWWSFFGYFMEIGDSLLSNIIHIRRKKAKGKKLDKWEQEFYQDNKTAIDLKTKESAEIQAEKDNILKFI